MLLAAALRLTWTFHLLSEVVSTSSEPGMWTQTIFTKVSVFVTVEVDMDSLCTILYVIILKLSVMILLLKTNI